MQGANEWTYPILLSKILRSVFAHRIVYARTTIRWRRHMRHSEEKNQNETKKNKEETAKTHTVNVFPFTHASETSIRISWNILYIDG